MSNGYENTEDRRTKPFRLWLCVLFIFEILLLAMPYIAMIDGNGEYHSLTIIEIILRMDSENIATVKLGILAIIFAIIPVTGFMFCAFDKHGYLKSIVSCICGFLGITALTFAVPQFSSVMAVGSMVSILVYLFIFAISVAVALKTMGIRAYNKAEEQKVNEHNEA